MSLIMADQIPRVKPEVRDSSRPIPGGTTEAPKRGMGFTKAPHDVLARTDLSDAALRLWLALQRFTWRGFHPENADLARACGWVSDKGCPATTKVKRLLRKLVDAGMVDRQVLVRDGRNVRTILEPIGALVPAARGDGSNPARPRPEDGPPRGPEYARGGGSISTPSFLDRCRKTAQDLPRSARAGEGSFSSTTTTKDGPPEIPTPPPASPRSPSLPPVAATMSRMHACDRPTQVIRSGTQDLKPERAATPAAAESRQVDQKARFLDDLRPELRAVFDGESERLRGSILAKFDLGADYALVSSDMVELLERRLKVVSAPPRRLTTPEQDACSLMQAAAAGDCVAPVHLAQRLVLDFGGDQKSRRAFEKLGKDLLLGHRTVDQAWHAYTRAMGPSARNRGAIFHVELRNSGVLPGRGGSPSPRREG